MAIRPTTSSRSATTACASRSRWPGRVYIHRGIAARQFQRSFVLADGIEVTGASLDNGLLNIDLRRPQPETKVRQVQIRTGNDADGTRRAPKTIDVGADD